VGHVCRAQIAQLTKAPTPKVHAAFLTMMAGLAFHAGRPEEGEDKYRIHKYPDVDHNDRPIRRVSPEQRRNMALFARVPQQAINVFMVLFISAMTMTIYRWSLTPHYPKPVHYALTVLPSRPCGAATMRCSPPRSRVS